MIISPLNNSFVNSPVQSKTDTTNNTQHIQPLHQQNSNSENLQQQMSNGSLQNTTEIGNISLNQQSKTSSEYDLQRSIQNNFGIKLKHVEPNNASI